MTNFFPSVSKYSNESTVSAIRYINKLTKYLVIFSILCSMLMFFYLNPLIYLWMGDNYKITYQILFYIHIIIFFEAITFSLLQIILPFDPKLFKLRYFVYEVSIRSSLILILDYTKSLSYESFLLITLLCKLILCIKLISSYKIINFKLHKYSFIFSLIILFIIYVITYLFYDLKIYLTLFYIFLTLSVILLFFHYKVKIRI